MRRLYPSGTVNKFLLGLIVLVLALLSAPVFPNKALQAYFSYSVFYSSQDGPFVETYLSIAGKSVNYIKLADDTYGGQIQVMLLFKQGTEIINFDKYALDSPPVNDTLNITFSFLDQQRYLLPNGQYDFELQISDVNSVNKPFQYAGVMDIAFPAESASFSGIQLVESFSKTEQAGPLSKHGYEIIPFVSNFFPENTDKLTFYCEIYNANLVVGDGEKYLLTYYLQNQDLNKPLSEYIRHKKETAAPVSIIFSEFNISGLSSGNYHLVLEARDKNNVLITTNYMFFQRSNPRLQIKPDDLANIDASSVFSGKITGEDTLRQYLAYLEPISSENERLFAATMKKSGDTKVMQNYLYKFWYDRSEAYPEQAWNEYLHEVNKVNSAYSTPVSKGFETDRGRVYLKYGPPNAISESYNEPGTYPYEIWHYYSLKDGQRNKKFVFYSRDLVTNDFMIIHSDATGELSNHRWQQIIYGRVDSGFDLDRGVIDDTWGGNSKKYFDIPR